MKRILSLVLAFVFMSSVCYGAIDFKTSRSRLKDTTINGKLTVSGNQTVTGSEDWAGGNVIYVPIGGNIETYANNAVAGDTLILASGVYNTTDDIDISKKLKICGQGVSSTTVSCVGSSKNTFHLTNGNISFHDMNILIAGDDINTIKASGEDYVIENCNLTVNGSTGSSACIESTTADDCILRNVIAKITTTTGTPIAISVNGDWDIYNTVASASSSGAASVARGLSSGSGTQNIYNSSFSTSGSASTEGQGIYVGGGGDVVAYNCIFNGTTADVECDIPSGYSTATLINCSLVNGTAIGYEIIQNGTIVTNRVSSSTATFNTVTTNTVTAGTIFFNGRRGSDQATSGAKVNEVWMDTDDTILKVGV